MDEKKQLGVAKPWAEDVDVVLAGLETTSAGLSTEEAKTRQAQYGRNELPEAAKEPLWKVIWDTFRDPMIVVLSVAGTISGIVGFLHGSFQDLWSALLLYGIVVFMAMFDFAINRKADKALEQLKQYDRTRTRVYRDGVLIEVDASELVVGDVISVGEGDMVPADARLIRVERLQTIEALLTGESEPITKTILTVKEDAALGDQRCMIFRGTAIEVGNGMAVVTAIGSDTQIGMIWEDLRDADQTETPLQVQLDKLAKLLMWGTLAVCLAVVSVYLWRGEPLLQALLVAVALAIAFIPEALGAVINISLGFGVSEMTQHGAIIKRLRAAEALGSITIMSTDKTGTITEGAMRAAEVWVPGLGKLAVNGDNGFFQNVAVQRLVNIAHLCNDLVNATDKALAELAGLAGFELTADTRRDRIAEIPFDSARKRMTTVVSNGHPSNGRMLSKGAPSRLLERCSHILEGDIVREMTDEDRRHITEVVQALELEAKRVIAFADRDIPINGEAITEDHEVEFTFVGLVALFDPIRPEVPATVQTMRQAGISAVMITGDSPGTALAIAKKAGIVGPDATLTDVVTGPEIDLMFSSVSDASELPQTSLDRIAQTRVFARVSPRNKTQIVKAMQTSGNIVAMSGDGVNDAPSLKQADVGIAMERGSDVTKATADVVLTGTYQALAKAVEVGRSILYRTQLYSHALLSTNGAEILVFVVAVLAGWPAPLTAVQLLLINILGDAWLSIALATERPEKGIMQQPPRDPKAGIISPYMFGSIVLQSVVTTAILAIAWIYTTQWAANQGLFGKEALVYQQSVIFTVFLVQKVLRSSFTARSLKLSIFKIGLFSNPNTLKAAALTIVLALVGLFVPIFGMTPLPTALLPLLALGLIPPAVEELVKLGRRIIGH